MTSVRRLVGAALAATAILALSACGNQTAGSAATFGDTRITEQELTSQVEEVQVAKGQPTTAPDQSLVQETLGRLITIKILDQLAEQQGVVISQGRIDEQLANYTGQTGSKKAVEDMFIQNNVAPSQIESIIRLQLQAQDIGVKIDPHGSAEEQGNAVFEAASKLSTELDTTVSPRYGTWDAKRLQLGAAPNDLSSPPAVG